MFLSVSDFYSLRSVRRTKLLSRSKNVSAVSYNIEISYYTKTIQTILYSSFFFLQSTSYLVALIQVLCVVFGENTPLYSSASTNTPSYAKEIPESSAASTQVQKPSNEHSLVKPIAIENPNVEDTRSRRAKLLLDVDAILTSAQIIKGQTEVCVV